MPTGTPAEPGCERKWGGIWVRAKDLAEVQRVLDQRPAGYTAGEIVAMLVKEHGAKLIARLNKKIGRTA